MVFSSLPFLFVFFPIVLVLYFIAPKKLRNAVLFFSSLVFYAWGEPVYIVIMLFSTVVDYTHGLLVEHFIKKENKKTAKLVVASSMIINLALLCFFKYSDFFISNVNQIFNTDIGLLKLALPIGISFYTFQTMSYTIDVYRGEAKAQRNIISFGAYVALFPQLIAGPIVQYKTIAKRLNRRTETIGGFSDGIHRFMIGLAKKVLLANNIGMVWDSVKAIDVATLPALTAWLGIIAFAFQIYFDFSGYSDMAIGLGKMLGFKFLENFNYPYLSKSITEFWRRWHISLGTWFKEYVYIPLGGNRKGTFYHIRNILIVWALTGFWHGASWNFMIWGLYFGVILIIEKLFLLKYLERSAGFIRHAYTLILILISWAIFAFDSMGQGALFIKAMFGLNGAGLMNSDTVYIIYTNIILFVVLALASTDFPKKLCQKALLKIKNPVSVAVIKNCFYVGSFLLVLCYLVDASYNPFLYFRF